MFPICTLNSTVRGAGMTRLWGLIAGAVVWFALAAAALAQPSPTAGAKPRLALSRVETRIPAGSAMIVLRGGFLCVPQKTFPAKPELSPSNTALLSSAFRDQAALSGFDGGSQARSMFAQDAAPDAPFLVGASVSQLSLDVCWRTTLAPPEVKANLHVQWQVYSTTQRRVVATVETDAAFSGMSNLGNDLEALLARLYGDAAHQLFQAEDLRRAVTTSVAGAEQANGPLAVNLVRPAGAVAIADALGSVVLIKSGDSLGSGFLVSADGYVLTDQHVVGTASHVRIRWADGIETDGEVLRAVAGRDVALIKTDPRGRRPLAIRFTPLQPGETVWAIGAPDGLQNSLTRGVVSNPARMFENFLYIQSDVTVTHGNSGGPLLDDRGAVVGLTDLAYHGPRGDDPVSINLFTPIRDALDFLHVAPPPGG